MAITTVNLAYVGQGPTADSQIVLQSELSGNFAQTLVATATWTGDASSSTAKFNYIDGTAKLSFTPSAVLAFRIGGAATATIYPTSVVDDANKQTATVTFATTVNAATLKCLVVIFA